MAEEEFQQQVEELRKKQELEDKLSKLRRQQEELERERREVQDLLRGFAQGAPPSSCKRGTARVATAAGLAPKQCPRSAHRWEVAELRHAVAAERSKHKALHSSPDLQRQSGRAGAKVCQLLVFSFQGGRERHGEEIHQAHQPP